VKWLFRLVLIVLLTVGGWLLYEWARPMNIPEIKVPGDLADDYAAAEQKTGIPWAYLAAVDESTHRYKRTTPASIRQRAVNWAKRVDGPPAKSALEALIRHEFTPERAEQILSLATSYEWAASSLGEAYAFPFRKKDRGHVSYGDTWGASRSYGGKRAHEGTDLMAPKGTPIVSVSDGRVVSKGWNELGGWRLTIVDTEHPQVSYYYAHLSRYAGGIGMGDQVRKGEVIGYVGDSGYGPEGTTGKFAPHLHFGMYVRKGMLSPFREAVNPFAFLKAWERYGG
jgi:peptidoglycan LD-endopeptidase LytH